MQTLTPMEKWKRDALADTLEGWRELLESALASPKRHPGGVAPVTETRPEPQQPGAAERRAVPAKSGGLHDGQRLPCRRVRLAGMGAAIGWK